MKFLRYSAVIMVLAVAFHLATIWLMPRVLLAVASTNMQLGGMVLNEMAYPGPRTADDRTIVRPSPDLLYSICLYDLTLGPVRIATQEMPQSYWSVSGFAANTDNFFVVNDRMMAGETVDILIGHEDQRSSQLDYGSPSMRGIILLRMTIEQPADLPALDASRRQVTCQKAS